MADFELFLALLVAAPTDPALSALARTLLAFFLAFSAIVASDCRMRRRAGNCASGGMTGH